MIKPFIWGFKLQFATLNVLIPTSQGFLNDYGLIWVGDSEGGDSAESDRPHDAERGQPGTFQLQSSLNKAFPGRVYGIPNKLGIFPQQMPRWSGAST